MWICPAALRAPEEEGTQAGCAEEGFGAHMADAVALQVQLLKGLRQVGRHEGQLVVAEVQHLDRWAETPRDGSRPGSTAQLSPKPLFSQALLPSMPSPVLPLLLDPFRGC